MEASQTKGSEGKRGMEYAPVLKAVEGGGDFSQLHSPLDMCATSSTNTITIASECHDSGYQSIKTHMQY